MIKHWAKVEKATGLIVMEGKGFDPENVLVSQLVEPGYDVFEARPENVFGATHYWDYTQGDWIERPALPAFSNPYDLTQLPAGTVVHVTGESGIRHEITDLSEPLALEGPQRYRVDVIPPAPYRKLRVYEEVA